jgi:20S proteasome alpha/beta subunit
MNPRTFTGIVVSLCLFCTKTARAQTNTPDIPTTYTLQSVIGPSPNASSLGQYADWPVNLYTGIPQIQIPIYEIKGRSLTVPISISYHASGNKVADIASWVGLGWALQAGGVVTRSVRGQPDETGYLYMRNQYHNPGDLSTGTTPASLDTTNVLNVVNGEQDSDPDVFMFSALGRSYKFIFLGNGTIVTQPFSNVKINVSSDFSTWTIILEDGRKLVFGGGTGFTEMTTWSASSQGKVGAGDNFISAWYLKSLVSSTGETINFTYNTSASGSYTIENTVFTDYARVSTSSPNRTAVSGFNRYSAAQLTPATIESDLCRVEFYRDSSMTRKDISGGSAIGSIKVFSKQANKYIGYYQFQHTYAPVVVSTSFDNDTTYNFRLHLTSMQQLSVADNSVQKTWTFQYNPNKLPGRHSYAQDHWGYFNGATNNTNLMPGNLQFSPASYPWANRNPDSASMMAEMLTQVNYPTGGYSKFTYEPNSIPTTGPVYGGIGDNIHLYLTYNQTNFKNTQTDTLHIPYTQYMNYSFRGYFSTEYMQDYGPSTVLASIVIKDSLGNVVSGGSMTVNKTQSGNTYNGTVLLNPGRYYLTVSSISPQGDFADVNSNVDLTSSYGYQGLIGTQTYNKWIGGVRIQSIIDNDSVAGNVNQRYFQYGNALVMNFIDSTSYVSLQTDNVYGSQGLSNQYQYYVRSSALKFGLSDIQGGTVAYGTVTTLHGQNGSNGYTVSQFTTPADWNIASSLGMPYPYVSTRDFERGLLLQQTDYTAAGKPVKQETNTYNYIPKGQITAYKAAYTYMMDGSPSYTTLSQIVSRIFYGVYTEAIQKTSTTEKAYNTATGDSLTETTTYFYDDTLNVNPTRSLTYNSKGDSVLIYTRTALELNDINNSIPLSTTAIAALDTMVARNMVGTQVESEKYTHSVLTTKVLTNFKLQPGGWPLPDNIVAQNAANSPETRIYFPRYSVKGNLLEQLKTAGEKHDYIWDYQSTYPVAEATNADSVSIAFTSFEADGTGNWSFPAGGVDSVTLSITGRKSYVIGNGAITIGGLSASRTYIVSYWSTGGSRTVSGSTATKTGKTVGGWTYYEHTVTSVTGVTVSGTGGNIDELRLYPQGSQMTSYTYEPLVGITSECDINNRITYYQYDGMERLWLVKDQDRNIVKEICYNYFGVPAACGTKYFYNVAESGTYTRNNCASGGAGGAVTYTVPAGKYASATSQADANQQAINDVNANGQAYANANGACTWYNVAESGTFTRNNCASGGTGGSVTYTVAANTYTSTISQTDANQQAINAVNTNGQAYANNNGSCTFYNVVESGTFTRNNCASGGTGGTVTYTVAAGTIASTISQADANQQAINAVNANGQAYANSNGSCTFWNAAQSGSFTRNNCSPGYGNTVTYTVTANTYSSTISQADADQQAINAVNANGQSYANANGTCTFYNVATSGTYTRNNCTCLYSGSSVTYTVAAMTYSSTVSQAAANTLAQNDVNANSQTYANANGTCTTSCSPPSQKIISCACNTGTYMMVNQYYDGHNCVTQYGYKFSDGTYTVTSSSSTTGPCK